MITGSEYLKENMENTNIPEEHYENEIGDMMEWYAEYYYKQKLHKFLQYLSDEDELVGNRTHQQIIDDFTTPANRFRLAK